MRVLIVDDSRAMRMILRRTLREAGFGHHETEEAADGAAALARLRAGGVDLVLSDWNMPQMNGIELLRALRGEQMQVPFGFVTSEGTDAIRAEALRAGALFVITKPFAPEDFLEPLMAVLGRARP